MLASEILSGDEFRDAGGNLVWTALEDAQMNSVLTVYVNVEWAMDGGRTQRVFVGDREMTGLVRPGV